MSDQVICMKVSHRFLIISYFIGTLIAILLFIIEKLLVNHEFNKKYMNGSYLIFIPFIPCLLFVLFSYYRTNRPLKEKTS